MNGKRSRGRKTIVAWMTLALVTACNQGSNREIPHTSPTNDRPEAVLLAQEGDDEEPAPSEPDWSNPGDVALQVVQAVQARNLVLLATLATVDQQQALSAMEPGTPEFEEFFDPEESWQIRAIQRFEGEILQCRIDELRARCQFSETDREEPAVVTLLWENGQWRYADINRPDSFPEWGTVWDGTNPPVGTPVAADEGTGEAASEGTGEAELPTETVDDPEPTVTP